jgi:osmotically-inducible protein OsmY
MAGKREKKAGGTQINIEGGVHAGRDVIVGDQHNKIVQKLEQNPSPSEFRAALHEVQRELAAMKQQANLTAAQVRNLEAAENQVSLAVEIASQPEPPVDEIKATLTDAKETMDLLSDSLISAVNLGALIGNLSLLAGRVFGVF